MTNVHTIKGYANTYMILMQEIRDRHAVMAGILDNTTRLPEFAKNEICYIQLRMTCELIALGCLVAHGDIPQTRSAKISAMWNAEQIMGALSALHPDFFPRPEPVARIGPPLPLQFAPMTKRGLADLYAESGRVLHRGAMLTLDRPTPGGRDRIVAWMTRLTGLLSQHRIQLLDPDHQLWCTMNTAGYGGRVTTYLMRSTGLGKDDYTQVLAPDDLA